MTLIGWAQIALVLACVTAAAVPLGRFIAGVAAGERGFLHLVLAPVERAVYAAAGVDPARGQGWRAYTLSMLAFNAGGFALLYAHPAAPGRAALQPAGLRRHGAVAGLQHGGELHHQHQLAGLLGRGRSLLPQPDGRADGAEFRLGGHRHRARPRAVTGLRGGRAEGPRQLLGRPDAHHPVRAAAAIGRGGPRLRRHGHAADPRRLCRGGDLGRRQADHRARARRLPGGHQAPRHQRRRLLRRERAAPLRGAERARRPRCRSGRTRSSPSRSASPSARSSATAGRAGSCSR